VRIKVKGIDFGGCHCLLFFPAVSHQQLKPDRRSTCSLVLWWLVLLLAACPGPIGCMVRLPLCGPDNFSCGCSRHWLV
jgi:hypothetical protein